MAWALAVLQRSDATLLEAIAAQSIAKIHNFSEQHLANTAWAFATLGYLHKPLMAAIASEALSRMTSLEPQ
eukprot:CAMPEP_0171082948 /NCGR_PEP_ID=MMETSP0766_2-20121228/17421_1 /TAXON_ID=439317 /ORGANISM="Gambierdiscus australes, Strain CAWD 149" /LENGTH=70 /DNA_ID=CAMNT_0011540355 /DNA_START=50 /DNA_END=259 /DNA_ORIENTATION=+